MEGLFKEALTLVEDDARWLDDAAHHCESLISHLSEDEKSKWRLLTAVYHERAKTHRELAARMRQLAERQMVHTADND